MIAREWATESALLYELSRGLHRDSSWLAERFGPIRISPLQCGHCQVEPLAVSVRQVSGASQVDYSIPFHALRRRLPHIQVEFRQDEIPDATAQHRWAWRFAQTLM
jgi:hypothetical protein